MTTRIKFQKVFVSEYLLKILNMDEGSRMWAISLLTIMFLLPLLSAAPLDIAGDIMDDNYGVHSHDENVTRGGKFFGHNRFDMGDMNISGSVAGDVVSIGHQVNIDVHGHTQDHHHHEDDTVIECKEGLRVLFKSIDSNKNGLMDAEELLMVCHQNNIQITESVAVRILTLPDKTVGFNMAKFCELLKDSPSTNSVDIIYFLLQLYDKGSLPPGFLDGGAAPAYGTGYIETSGINLDALTSWGKWGEVEKCSYPHFVNKMDLKYESRGGGIFNKDDTALNAIRLTCTDGVTISSTEGHWGGWVTKIIFGIKIPISRTCPEGKYINAARIRSEEALTDGDDTAANGIRFKCTDGSEHKPEDGDWGSWRPWKSCQDGSAIYGIQTLVQPPIDGDDTALNNVKFFCAKLPNRG